MKCPPIPTDTPGIFRCPECGLQNPRPISKPFYHQCGTREPIELPPLKTQVVSFLKSMAELAGDGFRLVEDDEFQRRVAICESCDTFDRRAGRCRKCGCYGKLKARGRVWKCPKGKW